MPPTLSWLDSSSAARRRALEVIRLFEEKGTVDEIGIGSVRDALSDALFPGTSVLHTRARYFLFIPWIYLGLEGRKTPAADVARKARDLEVGFIETLLANEDHAGTIGRIARNRLKQLPSTVYWSGLGVWGIRRTELSQDQYHRSIDRFYPARQSAPRDDDGQALDPASTRSWDPALPPAPAGFPRCALSFRLTRREADYLHERILTRCSGTLLAHLVDKCAPAEGIDFVWQHPGYARFPAQVKERLVHARNFSEVMHGAALLYNLMLAEKAAAADLPDGAELVERYEDALGQWREEMSARHAAHGEWDREQFWNLVIGINPRIPLPTRAFIDAWFALALAGDPRRLRRDERTRRLIADREQAIKGRLARLQNPEALRAWRGASGASQLDYRWNASVSRVVTDIQVGLRPDA